jgi:hypothetical protein
MANKTSPARAGRTKNEQMKSPRAGAHPAGMIILRTRRFGSIWQIKKAGFSLRTKNEQMKKPIIFFSILLGILGCQPARSDLFEERISPQLVEQLTSKADTVVFILPGDSLFINNPPIWVKGQQLTFREKGHTSTLWFDEQDRLTGLVEVSGNRTTDSIAFYPNGQRIFTILLDKDGNPSGPARYYYPDGRVKEDGRFEKGIKTGIWRIFRPDGRLENTEEYDRYGNQRK